MFYGGMFAFLEVYFFKLILRVKGLVHNLPMVSGFSGRVFISLKSAGGL